MEARVRAPKDRGRRRNEGPEVSGPLGSGAARPNEGLPVGSLVRTRLGPKNETERQNFGGLFLSKARHINVFVWAKGICR